MRCQGVYLQISKMNLVNKIMPNRNDDQNLEYKIQASSNHLRGFKKHNKPHSNYI